jgi:hypothetical protein
MSDAEVLVPIAFFFFVIGLPMTFWMISRFLAHQERVEMIRRGFMPPPVPPDPRMMRKAMQYGMPPNVPGQYYDPGYYAQVQLRRGIQVAFIGLALLIGLSFIGAGSGHYLGPWLLGGLIPMFVGIAQIISAILGGARIGTPVAVGTYQAREPEAPPAGTTAGNAGPPPPPSSYGGWRPGPIPEIEKPPGPPDYRP